ncbi:hypothetical protein ACNQGP_00675 [Flavobacterium sp. GT2N3]|uniref:hypothetical protein n=1 Tax=unclassified Flavobacterium TaxID=196869 RepID=UPI003AAC909C
MQNKTTKFHPILFSTPMVQAIMNGTKTQTRRVIKYPLQLKGWLVSIGEGKEPPPIEFCQYEVGDVLWVRETIEYFSADYNPHDKSLNKTSSVEINYKATNNQGLNKVNVTGILALKALIDIEQCKKQGKLHKWKPSIFMPKEACRTFLKIKSIRAERLQDISEVDAKAEGAHFLYYKNGSMIQENFKNWDNYYKDKASYKDGFYFIWHYINGVESWKANPFVWVYEFEKIEKPLDFI